MKKYDLIIVLLSRVERDKNGKYYPAQHTNLKLQATAIAYRKEITKKIMLSGGYNFWVRYDYENILKKADFSFEAFTHGQEEKSEAKVGQEFLKKHGVPTNAIFLEETSATSEENAEIANIILKRTTFNFVEQLGILTLAYHMERAFPIFQKILQENKFTIEPLFAEDLLAFEENGIEKIGQYYSVPKGGKQWPVEKIRKLLENGKSMGELLKV